MDKLTKLGILAEAARFDAACTSSGVTRGPREGMVGDACASGLCHSFSADGRCITLLKVLMSNACSFDCAYCVNRRGASCPRATFEPRELAELTLDFYKRNYIEGLFLSSAVLGNPDNTTERMIACLEALRGEFRFNGYVHAKVIPDTSPELVDRLGRLADRLSVNLELPSRASLTALCPDKDASSVMAPMAQIATTRREEERQLLDSPAGKRALARRSGRSSSHVSEGMQVTSAGARYTLGRPASAVPNALRKFVPAGQSTQLIIGATPEDDNHILQLSKSLYDHYGLKRIFFSAYMPMVEDSRLPDRETPVPLRREHRLYQADWLMRYYAFTPDELATPSRPWLDLDVDPKLAWALAHMERFPIEVMDASLEMLLRVPGIGPVGARRILAARRTRRLCLDDLQGLGIAFKRACYFVTCGGKRDQAAPLDADLIRRKVVSDAAGSKYNSARRQAEGQLSLF
ncbi:putative DNA modification/repair radical SAM protein [Olsenella sp. KH3B4]|uniref:putative DNA modification/repair radical SAM protein n=1 Tax=Olsenella sp. KH3B4 TaxID=1855394 RepID=UPI0008B3577D|nr:putative DNA modification/repair radical SAM protein [Olsenella sp. KH3B4]SES90815.1 putative DNA modification/repair radical SAM protein [Olsenella sp. KH3B4]